MTREIHTEFPELSDEELLFPDWENIPFFWNIAMEKNRALHNPIIIML